MSAGGLYEPTIFSELNTVPAFCKTYVFFKESNILIVVLCCSNSVAKQVLHLLLPHGLIQ
jgi:hypothetical protein